MKENSERLSTEQEAANGKVTTFERTCYLRLLWRAALAVALTLTLQASISLSASAEENISYAPTITNPADVKAVSIRAWENFTEEHFHTSGVGLNVASDACNYVLGVGHAFMLHTTGVDVSTSTNSVTYPDGELYRGAKIILPTKPYEGLIGDLALLQLENDDCLPEQVRFNYGVAVTGKFGRVQGYGRDENGEHGPLRQAENLVLFRCASGQLACLTNYSLYQKAQGGDSGAAWVTADDVARGLMMFSGNGTPFLFGQMNPLNDERVRWIDVCTNPDSEWYGSTCAVHSIPADFTEATVFLPLVTASQPAVTTAHSE